MSTAVKTVMVHRAGDLGGRTIEPCTIYIGECIDVVLGRAATLKEAELVYEVEAARVADALFDHLPQGALERVLLRLMERKVNSGNCLYKGATGS